MDAGQMNMMSQLPTGASITAAKPAPSAAVTSSAGDQNGSGSFAGVLLGASPSASGSSVAAQGAVKTGIASVSETAEESADLQQAEIKPDVMALLLATVGIGMSPPVVANTDGKQEPTSEQKVQEKPVPQNVAIWAAGTQMVLPQPDNGRMPEAGKLELLDGNAVKQSTPVAGVAGGTVPLNSMGTTVSGMLADSGQLPASATPLEEGMAQMALGSGLQETPTQSEVIIPGVILPKQSEEKNLGPKSTPLTPVVKSEMGASALKTPGSGTDSTLSGANATSEAAQKQETPALRNSTAQESGSSLQHDNAAAGRLSETGLVTDVSEANADQFSVVDGGKGAGKQHEVVFSRSSAVEAQLAGNQQASEKPAVMAENGLKAGLVPQVAEGKDGLADGSDPSGKNSEGFLPKYIEAPTVVTQQTQGGHQAFPLETLSPASSQPVQADAPRPVSHEQVASQVREQLVNHDLKPGSDQITFKLSPDHLGDIKVNLTLQDQRLKVEIVAENRAARDSLLQHVDALKESLARQNISIEKFDVTAGGSGAGSQGNNAQSEWRELARNRQSQQWLSSGGYRTPQAEAVPSPAMYQAQTGHAMVDLHF